jgi:glycosyltransferase involved in cell wall biosynthesis
MVSILIAAYNEEKYITEAIESCLNQTHSNIEVIVVDDGSKDRTGRIVKELSKNDFRIKYLKHEKNKGKVTAFNTAFNSAVGNYLCLMGGDDVSLPNRIEKGLFVLINEKLNLVYGNMLVCDECLEVKYQHNVANEVSLKDICFNNKIPGGLVIFDRKLASKIFPIPICLKFEDWWVSFLAVGFFKYKKIEYNSIKYRLHNNNDSMQSLKDTRGGFKRKDYVRHFSYYDFLENFVLNCSELPRNKREICLKSIEDGRYFKSLYLCNDMLERVKFALKKPSSLIKFKNLFVFLFGFVGVDFVFKKIKK